jgi:hypothetical protein
MLLSGGHVIFVGLVNTFVHIFMYAYYFVTNMWPEYKANLWWKKHVTQLQLVSFISTVHNTPRKMSSHYLPFPWLFQFTQTYYPSMEQSPSWEANSSPISQKIFHILCNPKVQYRIYNRLPPVLILNQSQSVPVSPSHFLKIHFNIILPYNSRSSKWSLTFRSPHQNPIRTSPFPRTSYTFHPSYSSWFDHAKLLIL